MIKRILALLLALLLCLSLVACKDDEPTPQEPPEEEETGGGNGGGDNGTPNAPTVAFRGTVENSTVTWKLMTNGELVIGGTGAMPDFATVSEGNDSRPWAELVSYIKTLTVEEGVTGLGEYAFKNLNELSAAVLPASLGALPYAVFENCTALKTVTGGVGLTLIDENAFLNCSSLATVSISTPLARVAYGAFSTGAATLKLHFTGSEQEWQSTLAAMEIAGGNALFTSAAVTCFPR